MTSTRAAVAAVDNSPRAVPVHSHEIALATFDALISHLRSSGWVLRRLDTYVHPDRPGWSIKHQFASGIWEVHLDRTLAAGVERTSVQISRYRPTLPTVAGMCDQLFHPLGDQTATG